MFHEFNGTKGVRKHIIEMRDIAAQLRLLEIEMFESFLVHFSLNSLLSKYGLIKISYNTHKKKWSVNKLLTMRVQEEGRLNQERIESAQLGTRKKTNQERQRQGKDAP